MANRRKGDAVPEVDLPITPMLDMAFQLLAFFVATFTPQSIEGQIQMALPASAEARAQEPEQADPTATPDIDAAEIKPVAKVIVRTKDPNDNKPEGTVGKIVYLAVEHADGSAAPIYPTPESVDADPRMTHLYTYLKKLQGGAKDSEDIQIKADGLLKYSYVTDVMDACSKAGFKTIGFAAPPELATTPNK
jgi:biopolymer transport protein ExbD